MGFLGVYTAIYPYQPQAKGELEISEGDLLYVLEKGDDDDWWKAKKKADHDEEDEPIGLVPNNYVEEARSIGKARALYDYSRQTEEEVSFSEDAEILVFDTSDPDWTLVGVGSDFGFAPANYIELLGEGVASANTSTTAVVPESAYEDPPAPAFPQRPSVSEAEEESRSPEEHDYKASERTPVGVPAHGPAAAIAGILHRQHGSMSSYDTSRTIPTIPPQHASEVYEEPEEDEGPPPALPRRPPAESTSPPRPEPTRSVNPSLPSLPQIPPTSVSDTGIHESPPYSRVGGISSPRSPSGYHIYNISEMVSVLGKRKKMPTALGINVATGTIFISPEDAPDNEKQEWTADRLSHYSIEGKHVFLDLIRPSRSIDFHAGAKDTAHEIVSALGEIAGAYKAEGLREVIAAGQGGALQKKGQILYDFMAQGDDEVTVGIGDEVVILDDTKSEEWWMVRRLKNGREGVVPSSYIEITGIVEPSSTTGINAGRSTVDQNRLEEERLAKEAARKSHLEDSANSRSTEVGPGMRLPERRSSLYAVADSNIPSQRQKRGKRPERGSSGSSKSKPDPTKVRKWVDRSATFTVEAQFIGLINGKIHLHKVNGVKIAVAIDQMSVKDIEYVEKLEGISLDEDKPLSDIKRRSSQEPPDSKSGAAVKVPDYDWFDFFLKAGVGPHQCERYAQNFTRDSMDESVLPDITPDTLRTLGLKEGDILRVMRHLDSLLNRTGTKTRPRNVSFGGEEVIGNGEQSGSGGLFAGEGGALRNNTRKGRPTPTVQAGDVVDPKAFEQKEDDKPSGATPVEKQETVLVNAPPPKVAPAERRFDDDAWEVKPPKQPAASTSTATTAPAASTPTPVSGTAAAVATIASTEPLKAAPLAGAMADLSLLQAPLQPTPAQLQQPPRPASVPTATGGPPAILPAVQPQQPQPTGANPSFFAQLPSSGHIQLQTGPAPQSFVPQPTGFQQPPQPPQPAIIPPRQRPQPPQTFNPNSLLPPPPQRPLSAPQDVSQQSRFGPPPLQPQLTGLPLLAPTGQSLGELSQQRFQQQHPQHYNQPLIQPQPTGLIPPFQNGLIPQITGFAQQQPQFGFQPQPYLNSQPTASPFADPRPVQQFNTLQPQATGYVNFSPPPQQPISTGINSVLPPALHPQPTRINGFGSSISPPPIPPIPQQPIVAPLQPQKTGPPPPVRFGVKPEAKKLQPQPTGLRANLAQATPSNPFGF